MEFSKEKYTTYYSPIVAKKGFNFLMAIALNDSFKLALIDIRAALLPAKSLERYIFLSLQRIKGSLESCGS